MDVPEMLVEENTLGAASSGDKQIVSRKSKGRGWSGHRTCSTVNTSTGQVQNKGRWTENEHALLLEGLQRHGRSKESWRKIATTLVKTRTAEQIEAYAYRRMQAGVDNASVGKVASKRPLDNVTPSEFLVHRRKLLAWVRESRIAAEERVMKIRECENATRCLDEDQEPPILSKDTDVLGVSQNATASDLKYELSADGDNQMKFDISNPPLLPPLSPPPLDSSPTIVNLGVASAKPSPMMPAYSASAYTDPPILTYESSSAYPGDLDSLQLQLLKQPLNTSSKFTKPGGNAGSELTTRKGKANVKVVARGKTSVAGGGTGKKRGTYDSYKDEAGQQKVRHAIETFLERRRKNSNASLLAFAVEVGIKYETLKPYCREDESKRKTFVIKGQTKLVPEVRFFELFK